MSKSAITAAYPESNSGVALPVSGLKAAQKRRKGLEMPGNRGERGNIKQKQDRREKKIHPRRKSRLPTRTPLWRSARLKPRAPGYRQPARGRPHGPAGCSGLHRPAAAAVPARFGFGRPAQSCCRADFGGRLAAGGAQLSDLPGQPPRATLPGQQPARAFQNTPKLPWWNRLARYSGHCGVL